MKQVLQNMKSGALRLADVPAPALRKGGVTVQSHASIISAGTERYLMGFARKSYIGKAKERPDLVRQVLGKVQKEGLANTYRAVMSRLDSDWPLGYSCAGVVTAVGAGVDDLRVGDRVACGGFGLATHSEVNFVPKNLVVRVPDEVPLEEAAYAAIGAIGLQGVRVLELTLGDNVVVIGLGLIGLLAMQLVRAHGGRPIGVDIDPTKVEAARRLGFPHVIERSADVDQVVRQWTRGIGADAVLVTAAAPTNDPLVLAVELSRRKGRIAALGNVPLEVPHRPFYEKELSLRMSTSLGPGRYDPQYEVDGHDYPLPYVRWTERRNMEAFLDLVADGQVRAAALTTHHFAIDDAEAAYALIDGKIEGERPLGVRFDYAAARGAVAAPARRVTFAPPAQTPRDTVRVGMVGAGPFARSVLLPALAGIDGVQLRGLSTATGITGEREGKRYGFQYATTDYQELLADPEIDLIVLATPHASHARMVIAALEAGKHVFVEKPLATRPEELDAIRAAWQAAGTLLHVGFNRRFSPFIRAVTEHFAGVEEPLFMLYRINAGYAPAGNEQQRQGGRIVGEGCHFIDTLMAIAGEPVERVTATSVTSHNASLVDADSVSIVLEHAGGHLGTVLYLARGSALLEKEHLEVHGGGRSAVLRDYRRLELFAEGRPKTMWRLGQDKGHAEQLRQVVEAVRKGQPAPVPFDDLIHVTEVAFEAAAQVGGLTNAE